MKKRWFTCSYLIALLVLAGSLAEAADWRFPVGLTYFSGINKVKNLYDDNVKAKYPEVKDEDFGYAVPVGITFNPYVEFENGVGAGLGIGPIQYVGYYIEYEKTENGNKTSKDDLLTYSNIPVSLDFRYAFMPKSNNSPYVRKRQINHIYQ